MHVPFLVLSGCTATSTDYQTMLNQGTQRGLSLLGTALTVSTPHSLSSRTSSFGLTT